MQKSKNIPVAAFRFWEQHDFKELLNEVMDKFVFFKFSPEEEKVQGKGYLLLEMFKIRRHINMLNMQPEIASEFFSQKWNTPISGYRIIKSMCKIKSSGIKKMFKELPVLICESEVTKAMNYLILALTASSCSGRYLRLTNKCHNRMPNNQAFVNSEKIQEIYLESSGNFHTYQKSFLYFMI